MNDKERAAVAKRANRSLREELGVCYSEIGYLKGRIAVLVDALDNASNVVDMFLDNNIDWNDETKKLQMKINDILEGERELTNQEREHHV
tara:strand:+ start:305 stop:574 length:270 start_codon:yes stop_codon:yes gene_type:complete